MSMDAERGKRLATIRRATTTGTENSARRRDAGRWDVIRRISLLLLSATLAGCLHTAPANTAATTGSTGEPLNLDVLKDRYRDPQNRARIETEIAAVFDAAGTFVAARARGVPRPAVVLDIDETSIDNFKLMLANDFGYIKHGDRAHGDCSFLPDGPCSSATWDALDLAPAEPGAVAFFKRAKANGVAVFFVTGRHEPERTATVRQLESKGFAGFAGLSLKSTDQSTTEYKTGERAKIEAAGYTIIANIGDQPSDLNGGHAERTFKIPNPYYLIP